MNIVKGKYGYGFNLDGTTDGHATPKSCAHQKFTAPNGTPAIDNQMYRIIGCVYGFRSDGVASGQIILADASGIAYQALVDEPSGLRAGYVAQARNGHIQALARRIYRYVKYRLSRRRHELPALRQHARSRPP